MPPAGSPPSARSSQVRQVSSSCPVAVPRIAPCLEKVRTKKAGSYAGIGIAMVTLIDSTVSVTIRHSDNAPIASETATAWVNREEATGAGRLSKPAAGRPNHGPNPSRRGANHPRLRARSQPPPAILRRRPAAKNGEIAAKANGFARYPIAALPVSPVFNPAQTPAAIVGISPIPGASPWRRSRGSVRPAGARRGSPGRSRGRSRSGRRHGCSRRARCRRP